MRRLTSVLTLLLTAAAAGACRKAEPVLTGAITADGSNTVYPLTRAVTDAFGKLHPDVRFAVGLSGTNVGFERFCRGEIDLQNASRPINADERDTCLNQNVKFVEIPVAYDALTIVVHPSNTWASTMTLAELKKIWEPGAEKTVARWSDVRSGWPNEPIVLVGPGPVSGTFDYFTEVVVGSPRASRRDYTANDDYNAVIDAVASQSHALGYVGYTYFANSAGKVKAVGIVGPNADRFGPLTPSVENVQRGAYQPLSRTLLIYVNAKSLERPETAEFVDFYLKQDQDLIRRISGIPMTPRAYELVKRRVANKTAGTIFADGRDAGNIELALSQAR